VPGQQRPACGHVFQSQRNSRNSGDFRSSRKSGEVSASAQWITGHALGAATVKLTR
jgi:hypothetical protein